MMNKAKIVSGEIAVTHTVRPDVGREFISFPINGWEDVEPLCKKVLLFDGRRFVFASWDSDNMTCNFYRALDNSWPLTARIV